MTKKRPTSFTLSEESQAQLSQIKAQTGNSKTVILERLIGEEFKRLQTAGNGHVTIGYMPQPTGETCVQMARECPSL